MRATRSGGGTDCAGDALEINVQTPDQMHADHHLIVPHGAARPGRAILEDMSVLLTSRLHIDLQRVSSAICSGR